MKLTNKMKASIAIILCTLSGMLAHPVNSTIIKLAAYIPSFIACIIIASLITKNK